MRFSIAAKTGVGGAVDDGFDAVGQAVVLKSIQAEIFGAEIAIADADFLAGWAGVIRRRPGRIRAFGSTGQNAARPAGRRRGSGHSNAKRFDWRAIRRRVSPPAGGASQKNGLDHVSSSNSVIGHRGGIISISAAVSRQLTRFFAGGAEMRRAGVLTRHRRRRRFAGSERCSSSCPSSSCRR